MNPRLQKIISDIERTKAKITELQELLPELERKKIDFENAEFIKMVRSLDVAPGDLTDFIEAYKKGKAPAKPAASTQNKIIKQEVSDNEKD